MRDLDQQPIPIVITESKEVRKDYTIIGQMVSMKGLILFEYNPETKILAEAEIKEHQVQIDKSEKTFFKPTPEVTVHKRVNYRSGCVYFQAINRKNALRKLDKLYKS